MPQTLMENRLIFVKNVSQLDCRRQLSKGITRTLPSLGVGCAIGEGMGALPGLREPLREHLLSRRWFPFAASMILCCLLLQESKPEQCLAGKSHSTGEQPSQLGMATRYSASHLGVL